MRSASLVCGLIVIAAAVVTASASVATAENDPTSTVPPTSTNQTPTVSVQTGSNRYLNNSQYSATLSLDAAVAAGALDEDRAAQIQAAAEESWSTGSGGEDVGVDGGAAGGASAVEAPRSVNSGECAPRATSRPADDPAWGGNDPAAGSLMVDICNGPETYYFVPNPAPGAAAPAAPPPPDPAVLAQQAYAELTLPSPTVHRSPSESQFGSGRRWVAVTRSSGCRPGCGRRLAAAAADGGAARGVGDVDGDPDGVGVRPGQRGRAGDVRGAGPAVDDGGRQQAAGERRVRVCVPAGDPDGPLTATTWVRGRCVDVRTRARAGCSRRG